ncbi:putative UDP-N-acetylhexosamine pyrophosphorylase [Blattamonas nauphoetae]|uniref:UDP-N-acetylglucosamine diphosphorylase n=1 Tax=Blattamonas nauphoetae TaxID=2049346 RepID=A0ABQ9Y6P6_9EUKA|nr:putative UDP-N-acetylhexosamine pyrophosphorylase [Blattamonas nauphoetae]
MQALLESISLPTNSEPSKIVERLEFLMNEATNKPDLRISPLNSTELVVLDTSSSKDRTSWVTKGLELVSQSRVAVVLLAGGLGTRLGSSQPKGFYDINLLSHKSLFQLFSERIVSIQKNAEHVFHNRCSLPLFVMTNIHSNSEIEQFFVNNQYFGLKSSDVSFFPQPNAPLVSFEGTHHKSVDGVPLSAPNGNGGVYEALVEHGILARMEQTGVEYIHLVGIDNAMCVPADPVFVGLCANHKCDVGNKVVRKRAPEERVGVFCWKSYDGSTEKQYGITEYSEMTPAETSLRNADGSLLFSSANIVSHCLSMPFLRQCCERQAFTEYHISKKTTSFECEGVEVPGRCYKLERFIFDTFSRAQRPLNLEVSREDSFSPVKNREGSDSPQTAREMLYAMWKQWLETSGGIVDEGIIVEISPLVSTDGRELEKYKGQQFSENIILE